MTQAWHFQLVHFTFYIHLPHFGVSLKGALQQLALRNDAKVEENKEREPQLPQLGTKERKLMGDAKM